MRRIMWISLGFALFCAVGVWFVQGKWLIILAFLCAIACVGCGVISRERKPFLRSAYFLLGCTVGAIWFCVYSAVCITPIRAFEGERCACTAVASDYSQATDYGARVDATLWNDGKSYAIRLYFDDDETITPGDSIRGTFDIRMTLSADSSASSYYPGEGVFLIGYACEPITVTHKSERGIRELPAILRENMKSMISDCFPDDAASFAKALLLGDGSGLDYETETAFKLSGIRHIIAVSGLHISILYAFLRSVTFKRRYLTAMIGIPTLFLFAAIVGFTPSVTRATIMVCLMMIATAFDKEYDGATALSFAALVMLLVNPYTITSISFQLSVASVAGIFLFRQPIAAWLGSLRKESKGKGIFRKIERSILSSASVSISAVSLTTPLCAYYFGAVSLVSVLTNLLTLWAVSYIFYGVILVCLISGLFPGLAALCAKAVSILIRYVLFVSRLLSRFPLSAVYTKSIYIVLWLAFVYVLLIAFLVMRKKAPFVLICCVVIGLVLSLMLSWMQPLTDECRVTVFDVGQGQSILLQSEGKSFLVDCGGTDAEKTSDLAAETLLSQGISHLDGLILTHYDDDHAGAVTYLFSRIDVDTLFLPDTEPSETSETILNRATGQIVYLSEDSALQFGEAKLTIYAPISRANSNENSLCVLFETENCAILITGDRSAFGERTLLRYADLPKVDLLVAGHHGSKSSTCEELLDAVKPDTVAISVGVNRYGHPAEEVLERLEKYGCVVYRTDEDGTLIFRR